jgi:hypothetical protein
VLCPCVCLCLSSGVSASSRIGFQGQGCGSACGCACGSGLRLRPFDPPPKEAENAPKKPKDEVRELLEIVESFLAKATIAFFLPRRSTSRSAHDFSLDSAFVLSNAFAAMVSIHLTCWLPRFVILPRRQLAPD